MTAVPARKDRLYACMVLYLYSRVVSGLGDVR